tara:strand:- start:149 stop:424 length:276 start_codon:yes stop_codon:yes gene_type:complete
MDIWFKNAHYELIFNYIVYQIMIKSICMSSELDKTNFYSGLKNSDSISKRVNVNDLVSKMNEDKRKERKNSLVLGAAAVSAVTVFGIILTL